MTIPELLLLELEKSDTWPSALTAYLSEHLELFRGWEVGPKAHSAADYDLAVYGLMDVLQPFSLRGWHCTRLTPHEIDHILAHGMALPNEAMLHNRLDGLVDRALLDTATSARLKARNQANDTGRAGMVWFLFYPPHRAGEWGIERFFIHWGGEALYNSHEDDPVLSPILASIGQPCLIEADIPIASLPRHGGLYTTVIRRFLDSHGVRISEPMNHQDRIKQPLDASNVRRIIRFPETDFLSLTGCSKWRRPIRNDCGEYLP